MTIKNRLMIKEFSRLCQVTVKTLRHYEKMGLIRPAEVDEWTGYRYYDVGQMQRVSSIRSLKSLGFSLDEILEMMEDGYLIPSPRVLREKIDTCCQQLALLEKRKRCLQNMMDSQNKITDMKKFQIQPLPEIIVASHREVIKNYAALGALCVGKIGPEMSRLGCVCTQPGYCFTVEHHEYRPENIDIEYCEQVEEMGKDSDIIQFKRLEAVPKALCVKHTGPYERFYETFTEAFRYMDENGMEMAGQPRTSYIDGIWNQEDPEKWVSLIQIPIK